MNQYKELRELIEAHRTGRHSAPYLAEKWAVVADYRKVAALLVERDGLIASLSEMESDYLRRHKDACDRAEEVFALKAEVQRLRGGE